MKIIIFASGTGGGGIEKSLIEFLKYLSTKNSLSVDLYLWRSTMDFNNSVPPQINFVNELLGPKGIRECNSCSDYLRYFAYRVMRNFYSETKIFRRLQCEYDVAISFTDIGYSPHYVIDKVNAKKKIIFYHNGTFSMNGIRRWIEELYYKKYDQIATVSNANVQMLRKEFPSLSNKISLIGNLLNVEDVIRLSQNSTEDAFNKRRCVKILTVARASAEKGYELSFEAAKILKERCVDFQWFFMGGGMELERYKNYTEEAQLDDTCILLGYNSNPYPYIKECDIYVQPSLFESYSITIREAAVFGVPIVATNLPAIVEAQSEIKGIELVDFSSSQLASKLNIMISGIVKDGKKQFSTKLAPNFNERCCKAIDNMLGLS